MNGRKTGTSRPWAGRLVLRPIEDRKIWRADAVPDLLDRVDVETERLARATLASRAEMPMRRAPCGELEQGETAVASRWSSIRGSAPGASARPSEASRSTTLES
jgi:hypothetical protein